MGGKVSKQSLLEKHGHLLTSEERVALNSCFNLIASSSEADSFDKGQLKDYLSTFNLSDVMCSRLFSALSVSTQAPPTNHVTYINFIENVSWLCKGSHDQRSQLFHHLIAPPLTLDKVENLLTNFLNAIFTSNSTHFQPVHDWTSNEDSLKVIVNDIMKSLRDNSRSSTIDKIEVQIWLVNNTLANMIIQLYMMSLFICPHIGVQQMFTDNELVLPQKVIHPLVKVDFVSQLLDQSFMMYIHNDFSFDLKGVVYPLFSTKVHGESFSTLCRQIIDKGPTLIVIRDKDGHVFGGMSGNPWKFTPQFIGGSGCFLFTLKPSLGIYMPTGYNENYMYLQQTAQTLPNGLGMGGQIDYFGLWVSADFGRGHSKARPKCSTFGSPCLSCKEEFEIDVMEVWGIGRPIVPDDDDDDEKPQKSILDVDKEAKALLEIAGKPQYSEGLREVPDDDD